jgi:hypothetical protein
VQTAEVAEIPRLVCSAGHDGRMGMVRLFSAGRLNDPSGGLTDRLQKTGQAVAQRLQTWNADDLLNTPVDDVVDELVELASVHCPELLVEEKYFLDATEVDQKYGDWGEIRTRRVTRFVLVVPYEGDKDVFTLQANRWSTMPPEVLELRDGELRLVIDDPPSDPVAARLRFDEQIRNIEGYLAWSRQQIDEHNRQIRDEIPGMVARRRDQLLAARNLQADIGYPVRRRADADRYSTPVRRKTVKPQSQRRPAGGRVPFKPEPAMDDADYRAALEVLRSQQNALERTPSLAAGLKEEQIRDLLLLGLNAQFEGAAGGELFNGEGKTDILIRVDDRNIFIGECKVWSGPKTMDEALDQLFRYLVWRDTKAALLLFIRRQDVTAVIERAIAKIEEHPYYKRRRPRKSGDEQFEFTMHAQDDVEREIHLTLVPSRYGQKMTASDRAGWTGVAQAAYRYTSAKRRSERRTTTARP